MNSRFKINEASQLITALMWILSFIIGFLIAFGIQMFSYKALTNNQLLDVLIEGIGTSIALLLIIVTIREGGRMRAEASRDRKIEYLFKKREFYSLLKGKLDSLYEAGLAETTLISNFETHMNTHNIENVYLLWTSGELQMKFSSYFAFYHMKYRGLDYSTNDTVQNIADIANLIDDEFRKVGKELLELLKPK